MVSRGITAGGEGKTGQSIALPSWSERARKAHLIRKSCHSSSILLFYFFSFLIVPHGLLGPGPIANGFPPGGPGGPKAMQHFPLGLGDLCQVGDSERLEWVYLLNFDLVIM